MLTAVEQVLLVSHLATPQCELLPCAVVDGRCLMPGAIDDVLSVGAGIYLDLLCLLKHLPWKLGSMLGFLGHALARSSLQLCRLREHRLHRLIR